MNQKRSLWLQWIGDTLIRDLEDPESPDPVPVFAPEGIPPQESPELKAYRRGKNDGEYLYLLYLIDGPADPHNIIPVYVGESANVSQRLYNHVRQMQKSLPTDEWEDTGDWGSFSKYDHMAHVFEQASGPLYVWIVDVEGIEHGPYGYSTSRQELEAAMVGLIHAQPEFDGIAANREFVPNRISHEIGKAGPAWVTRTDGSTISRSATPTPNLDGTQISAFRPSTSKAELLDRWISNTIVPDIQSPATDDPIALFETDDEGRVELTDAGVLRRSAAIDERIRAEGKRCLAADGKPNGEYDGLLYLLYQLEDSAGPVESRDVVPRYFGKAEVYGKKRELSSNFVEIANDRNSTRSFARWGDGNYWHVGELSMTLRGESDKKVRWAEALFEDGSMVLKRPTYLWVRAWKSENVGPYGVPATLAEVEALLIGLAYDAFPERLLNVGGTPNDHL